MQPGVAAVRYVVELVLLILPAFAERGAKMAVGKPELAPVETAAAAAAAELVVAGVAVAAAVVVGLEATTILMVRKKYDKHSGFKLTGRALFRCAC